MDLDLKDLNWEKKALIALGVVTLIVVIYAFAPFGPKSNSTVDNQTSPIINSNNPGSNNSNPANNTTSNSTTNTTTFRLTKEEAKRIASQPGYTTGDPRPEIITINGNSYAVWVVPLIQFNKVVKEVVVDANTGTIREIRQVK